MADASWDGNGLAGLADWHIRSADQVMGTPHKYSTGTGSDYSHLCRPVSERALYLCGTSTSTVLVLVTWMRPISGLSTKVYREMREITFIGRYGTRTVLVSSAPQSVFRSGTCARRGLA